MTGKGASPDARAADRVGTVMPLVFVLVSAASLCVAQPGPATDKPALSAPSPERIEKAVKDLGDNNFAVRERASRFLWLTGRAAEPALREALKSPDAEVVVRARRILNQFKYGIYPDTPPEMAALIVQFRLGDVGVRQQVLRQLADKGEVGLLLTLLKSEDREAVRRQLTQSFLGDVDKIVPHLLASGETGKAEQFLELAATGTDGMRNYAAYLLVTGKIDAKMAEVRERVEKRPDANDARLLAYLFRARGDLNAASKAAEKADNEELTLGLLRESGQWSDLAERQKLEAAKRSVQLSRPVESLGYLAAYQRLAGRRQEFDEAVSGLKKLAGERPETRWHAAEALLINGRIDDAIDLLRAEHQPTAFDLLAAQLRFREALALEGVVAREGPATGPGPGPGSEAKPVAGEATAPVASRLAVPRPWMALPPRPQAKSDAEKSKLVQDRLLAGVRVASLLARLGEKDTAAALFSELAQAAEQDRTLPVRAVIEAEYEAGMREAALQHAALAIERLSPRLVLGALYPKQSDTAEVWYEFFMARRAGTPPVDALIQVDGLMGPPRRGAARGALGDDALRQAEDWARTLAPPLRFRWLTALGETCQLFGRAKDVRRYFEEADGVSSSAASRIRVGDLLAGDRQWQLAADCYRQAWERDKRQALPLYLHGRALEKAGRTEEAAKWKGLAELAPLANTAARYQLAKGLQDRDMDEDAARQWDLIVRTGAFDDWAVNEASKNLGNRASGKDNLLAATLWDRLLLSCLKTSTAAARVEGYLRLNHLIHKARGRGLLAAGRIEEALAEIELARQALPGEGKLAEDVVPELEKAGRKAEADALFEKVFASNRQALSDFPKAAVYHNNAAWVAARCGRRLDEALALATRATELAPDDPGYLDTLAEVHFRRGNRAEAVRLAKRCVELAPGESHFKGQLERFEKGEP